MKENQKKLREEYERAVARQKLWRHEEFAFLDVIRRSETAASRM